MKNVFVSLAVIFSLLSFSVASAAMTIHAGEYIGDVDDIDNQNVYITASNIVYSSSASKDVTLTGTTVYFDGKVEGDLTIIGRDVVVTGEVAGDIKIVAAKARYFANAQGDVLSLVGELEMLESSTIGEDAMLYGGTVKTGGSVEGNTSIIAGRAFLQGSFSDNVSISAQTVTVGNIVLNNFAEVDYSAPSRAQILGNTTNLVLNFNETGTWQENGIIKHSFLVFVSFWTVLRFFTTLIIIFFFTNIFRRFTQSIIDRSNSNPIKSFITGVAMLFGIPILALLLVISLVGLPIGLLFGLGYASLFVVRYALMSIVFGGLIKKALGRDTSIAISNFWYALLGLVLITFIAFIPYVGNIFIFALTFIAFGSVGYAIVRPLIRFKK